MRDNIVSLQLGGRKFPTYKLMFLLLGVATIYHSIGGRVLWSMGQDPKFSELVTPKGKFRFLFALRKQNPLKKLSRKFNLVCTLLFPHKDC